MWDVLIVGGGPAGLSAALILGRCRRHVLVCDAGRPRNAPAHAMHGFLSRDGMSPHELLAVARAQLQPYSSVELRQAEVTAVAPVDGAFEAMLSSGEMIAARKVLLATGVVDVLPAIDGLRELYGGSVFHCPYCDGWEVRDQELAVIGGGHGAAMLALKLTVWSADVVLCTHGGLLPNDEDMVALVHKGISIRTQTIRALEGDGGKLRRFVFHDGSVLPRQAAFFCTDQYLRSDLAEKLGCRFTEKGVVETGKLASTCIPGVYVAGDASDDPQMVVVAAAEGAQAAVAINEALLEDSLRATSTAHATAPADRS